MTAKAGRQTETHSESYSVSTFSEDTTMDIFNLISFGFNIAANALAIVGNLVNIAVTLLPR